MYIHRDISTLLSENRGIYIHILIGPRQCGKSTLFAALGKGKFEEVTLDDFQMRNLAEADPTLFLSQFKLPLIIDEIQYAPSLFPEIKKMIDQLKRKRLFESDSKPIEAIFYLTGSNQLLLDHQVKETLVGRASYFQLNTLSVHEIKRSFPDIDLQKVIFQGGWPELYTNANLDPVKYLNNYIRNYIEKDIVVSAGIIKKKEFHTVLGMLAARSGSILNHSSLAKDSGVKSVTIQEWVSVLERTSLLYLLPPFETNLNKRLTKAPKIYFLDTGLAARLQGWMDIRPLLNSPQAGSIFETLVLSEIVKFISNFGKNWRVYLWRTKEGEEIDFIIDNGQGKLLALDAKMSLVGSPAPLHLPHSLAKTFPEVKQIISVTYGGKKIRLSDQCLQVPLFELTEFLLEKGKEGGS